MVYPLEEILQRCLLAVVADALIGKRDDGWLDGWIFAGDNRVVREVWVHGRPVVEDGRHPARDAIRSRYAAALARLMG